MSNLSLIVSNDKRACLSTLSWGIGIIWSPTINVPAIISANALSLISKLNTAASLFNSAFSIAYIADINSSLSNILILSF